MQQFVVGSTSKSINVFIQDSSSTTGAGLSGLLFNTAGLAAYYSFTGATATAVAIPLVTLATVTTAYSSGGFIEIDAVHMKGWYRLDLPTAVLAAAKGPEVSLHLYGATNMAPCPIKLKLTGMDNQDGVRGGMSAIPNTPCTTNASLLTSGTGTDQLSVAAGKVLLQATQTGVTIPTVTTVTTVSGSVGSVTGNVGGNVTGSVGSVAGNVAGNVVGSVGSVAGNVTGSVGSVVGNVGGNVLGSVGSVAGNVYGDMLGNVYGTVQRVITPVEIDGTVNLMAARPLDSVSDTNLTWNDVAHCAIAAAAGKETTVGTAYTIKTPSTGTVLRTFVLDNATTPSSRT